jgi:hypothetical protein
MLSASSVRPLAMSQRGDSGMKKMKISWMMEGRLWLRAGMRQHQSEVMRLVPKVSQVQIMAPRCQRQL